MIQSGIHEVNNGLFKEFFSLIGKLTQSDLVRQIEYLKAENEVLRSKAGKRVSVTPAEKRRLLKFGLPLKGEIKKVLSIVSYATFRRWAAEKISFKIPNTKRGRPRTKAEICELVLKMARENDWGYTRILGELKKLHIKSLSRNTIKNILKENGLDPAPKRYEDTWDAFIKREFQTLWACDFFTKTVWTLLGPKTFHVLFFINIRTRKVHIAGMTQHPKNEWVTEHTKSLSFAFNDGEGKHLLVRDRDTKFTKEFDEIFKQMGYEVRPIPYRSPNLNPYAEGWVGTIKRECLNKFMVFGEEHLNHLISEYVKYYNTVRPHSAMGNMPLDKGGEASVKKRSWLGGTLNDYRRE